MEREVKTKRRETIKKGKQSKDSEKRDGKVEAEWKEDGKQRRERGKLRLAGRKAKIS